MGTKTLYLIRHAKAEEHSFLKKDFDRNLVDEGVQRANTVAVTLQGHLKEGSIRVISSTASRAKQTAEIFCNHIGYPIGNIQLEESLYEAYHRDILDVISRVSAAVDTLLVFGHNPGLSELTNYLCNSYIELKTAHAAKIILPEGFDFDTLSGGTADLETIITE